MEKPNIIGKFFIIKDLEFSDFMKNDKGEMVLYNSANEAANVCGMYEFDAIVCEIKYVHKEEGQP